MNFLLNGNNHINNINDIKIHINLLIDEIIKTEATLTDEQKAKINLLAPLKQYEKEKLLNKYYYVSINIYKLFKRYQILFFLYITMIFVANEIDKKQYIQYIQAPMKESYDRYIETPYVHDKYKPIKDNFGHKFIYKVNTELPNKNPNIAIINSLNNAQLDDNYQPKYLSGGTIDMDIYDAKTDYKYTDGSSYIYRRDLLKQLENTYEDVDDQEYVTIKRYFLNGFESLEKYNPNEPTFCHSLFVPDFVLNNIVKLANENIDETFKQKIINEWFRVFERYISQLIVILNIYTITIPNSSTILYIDSFLLETFSQIPDNHPDINLLFENVKFNFSYNDSSDKYLSDKINNNLDLFYEYLTTTFENQHKTKPFKSMREHFIELLDIASNFSNNKSNIYRNIEIYEYKFQDNFINEIDGNKFYKDNGFIGSLIRYISLSKRKYSFTVPGTKKKINIDRPKHLIWLDPHTSRPGIKLLEWINNFNYACNKHKKEVYLLPNNYHYNSVWHDLVKDDDLNWQSTKSALAGLVQIANFADTNDDEGCMNDINFRKTIGLGFTLDKNDNLLLYNFRPIVNHSYFGQIHSYNYGIDEYVLTNLFVVDNILKFSIYNNFYFIWDIWFTNGGYYYYNASNDSYKKLTDFLYNDAIKKTNTIVKYDELRDIYYLNIKELDELKFIKLLDSTSSSDLNNIKITLFNDINKTNMDIFNEINNRIIQFKYYLQYDFINDIKKKCLILLCYYLRKHNYIYDETIIDLELLITIIDEIRNNHLEINYTKLFNTNKEEFYCLSLVLAIFPSQYNIREFICLNTFNIGKTEFKCKLGNFLQIFEEGNDMTTYKDLTFANLATLKIDCNKSVLNSPLEYNGSFYTAAYDSTTQPCSFASYYSGFLHNPPSYNKAFQLLHPTNIANIIEHMDYYKTTRHALEKTDYGIIKHKNNDLWPLITNKDLGEIIYSAQNLIKDYISNEFNSIYIDLESIISKLINKLSNPGGNMNKLYKTIIWRILLFGNIRINNEWSKFDTLVNEDYHSALKLNKIIEELGNKSDLIKYIIYVLNIDISRLSSYNYQGIINDSTYKNYNIDSKYFLPKYEAKYYKYKHKYLNLMNYKNKKL